MQTTYQMFMETVVPEGELIVSRTDLKGIITYANETFSKISGYEMGELVGKSHSIVRHPDMPRSLFKELWETLHKGAMWKGYVKNMRKDGGYYWVYAEVSGVYKDGVLIEYKSLRTPIDSEMKAKMQALYDARKRVEEKCVRVVTYMQSHLVEKIEKLASDEKCMGDTIINSLLNDALF